MEKLIIFDLDGTLIDSLPDIADSINVMLTHFGYKTHTEKEIMTYIGNGARKIVERSLPSGLTEERITECLRFYNKTYIESGSPKTKVFDGVKEAILKLKERGYKLAILSNKPQPNTDEVYKTYLSDLQFDMCVGQSEKVKCKPNPEATLNIIKELNANIEETYFVGDGETDVQTSINAGLIGISALWGYRDKAVLIKEGAKIFASNPKDLLSIIK